jgi:flavodoxin I
MKPLGIFFGSSSSNTEEAAHDIAALLCDAGHEVDIVEVDKHMEPERLREYKRLLIGCPTWDIGQLQSDWDRIYCRFGDIRFDGQAVALFGCGDAVGYPDTFQDAIGILGRAFRERGAALVGRWPADDYDFSQSEALEDGHFLGLALDYDNEPAKCEDQIHRWVQQIVAEFGLQEES